MWSIDPNHSGKSTTPPDAALARLAAPQHGVVTRHQLFAAGINAKAIGWRGPVDVTAHGRRRHAGIKTHRSRTLSRADITRHYGDHGHETGPTRSELEDLLLRFIARHHLPKPEVNQTAAGYEVDMLYRDQRLIVELDSRTFHRHTFEEHREREAGRLRRLLNGEGGIRTLGRG